MPLGRGLATDNGRSLGSSLGGEGSAAVPVLPTGALGVWWADEYVSTPRKQIPNAVAASPSTNQNLWAFPRGLFSNTACWNKGSVTIVDDAVTGPSGNTDASTFNASAGWFVGPAFVQQFPAGTYTVGVWAKRNTGSDQSFAFSPDNTGTRSAVKTATATWQRFTYTFTKGAAFNTNVVLLCDADGSTAANLQIDGLELFAGSDDQTEALVGNLIVGGTNYSTNDTWSGGELDLTGGGLGSVLLEAAETMTATTAIALVSKTAAGSVFQATLSKVQNYGHYSAMTDQSNTEPQSYLGGNVDYGFGGLWRLLNRGYHMITHTGSASQRALWLDKSRVFIDGSGMGSVSVRDFFVGVVSDPSLNCGLKIQAIALYDRVLSRAEIEQAYDAIAARVAVAPNTTTRVVAFEGDSLTAANGSFAYQHGGNATVACIGAVWATNGASLATLTARASDLDEILADTAPDYVLTVLIGANDLKTYTGGAAQFSIDLAAYCDARRAAGWKVVICTILPQTDATHNTRRAIVNADIAGWVGVHVDGIADLAANGTIGDDADAANVTYYYDGLHLTAAGYTVAQPIVTAAIDAV